MELKAVRMHGYGGAEQLIYESCEPIMREVPMQHQSFLNPFINPKQDMPDGCRIGVGLRNESNKVRIEIEDAGQGVPADLLTKIWDPLFTTKEKGTGLGLGIVKNIVEAHGGSIGITNCEEQGARVTIELPVSKPEGDA